jgi:predicted nuclease of predicted toxin-antitoxin system
VIRLLSDQNFNAHILNGLLRRVQLLDVVRIQDVGLSAAEDPAILDWAAREGRVLITHDRRTIPRFAYERVRAGEPMAGVFIVDNLLPVGQAIDQLVLAVECSFDDEWKDRVLYFPL